MPLRDAREIDALYGLAADYDLVLTADAPLRLALERRVDTPQLGYFAATPFILATDDAWPQDKRDLFGELVRDGFGWKETGYVLDNLLDCWERTGSLDAILDYPAFDTPAVAAAIDVVRNADSAHGSLAEYELDPDHSVAVIDEASFTELDRTILPDEYDTIDPFGGSETDLPEIHAFDSTAAVVEAVVSNVTPETADRVGVVVDRASAYATLLESAFEAEGISFEGGPGFADDEDIRAFLRCCRLVLGSDEATVEDVRPLLSALGDDVPISDDARRLAAVETPGVDALRATVGEPVREAIATYERLADAALTPLADELAALDVLEEPLSAALVGRVTYYLSTVEPPVDRNRDGVLLSDASGSTYVDRPVVFYVGMDDGWVRPVPDRPWVDRERADRQHLAAFERLLQNGQQRYLLVQASRNGDAVTPPTYLHDLVGDVESYTNLPHTRHRRGVDRRGRDGFEREASAVSEVDPSSPPSTLSQSALNTFVNCPRDYYFDRLLDGPEHEYLLKGTLVHEFAELYVADPDAVRARIDAIIEVMGAALSDYTPPHERSLLETELRAGCETVMAYLDANPPAADANAVAAAAYADGPSAGAFDGNALADAVGIDADSALTERWFRNERVGGHGVVDLLCGPGHLLDYKTGRREGASTVLRNAAVEPPGDAPNYQAPMYLTHHRTVASDQRIDFTFLYVLDAVDEYVTDDLDPSAVTTTVPYFPWSFDEFVSRRESFAACTTGFDPLADGVSEGNARRKTLEKLGYDAYRAFFEGRSFPDTDDRDELLSSDLAEEFTEYARTRVGAYKYVDRGTDSALKKLFGVRRKAFFADDLDAFETFLSETRDALADCLDSRFPVGDPNDRRLSHPELILDE